MKTLRSSVIPFMFVTVVASVCVFACRSEPRKAGEQPLEPGTHGTYTYKAIDGTDVTVGREAPPEPTTGVPLSKPK